MHQSVLLKEAIEGLKIKKSGTYIDATFGRGGHSQAILTELEATGSLLAIDKDPSAIEFAKEQFEDSRFQIQHGSFASIAKLANDVGITEVDGILMDLGVSSPQLDEALRGFSFMREGPLDMRMDTTSGVTAEAWVNTTSEEDMAMVFKTFGEERFSKRIANAIVTARREHRITTTTELADIVKKAHPRWEKHKHPATRVFQAIRIYINSELDDLKTALTEAIQLLNVGGRFVVISFHSLEDRMVKRLFRDVEKAGRDRKTFSNNNEYGVGLKRIGKAIFPGEEEIKHNVRARSAVMRVVERMA